MGDVSSKMGFVRSFLLSKDVTCVEAFDVEYKGFNMKQYCLKWGAKVDARLKTQKAKAQFNDFLLAHPVLKNFLPKPKDLQTSLVIEQQPSKRRKASSSSCQEERSQITVYVGFKSHAFELEKELKLQLHSLKVAKRYCEARIASPQEVVLSKFLPLPTPVQ